ncbi:MAG: VOC family protein [Puniceicoccales bacterium]|jgi:4-hydroxyphenylpyruvate dioxygenase-like putative hemolysin|nr:VOC family protein [Puniceicoccales bacterium]
MVTRVDHIDLRVADVEKFVEQFKMLGFIEIRRIPEPRLSIEIALPGENQMIIEVRTAKEGESGINHVAFKVDSTETISELKEKGIEFKSENRLVKDTGRSVSNFKDPFGNSWQLTD